MGRIVFLGTQVEEARTALSGATQVRSVPLAPLDFRKMGLLANSFSRRNRSAGEGEGQQVYRTKKMGAGSREDADGRSEQVAKEGKGTFV